MTRRVNMHLDEELAAEIERHKPRSLALSAFCALLIEQQLTRDSGLPNLPAYRVGAGKDHTETLETQRQGDQQPTAENGGLPVVITESSESSGLKNSSSSISLGEGVGKGVQGETPRKGETTRAVVENLVSHTELIEDFWRVKQGSKGQVAWKLLMTELSKLQKLYGDAVVEEQLQLAINGKWQGVRLSNYEQFKPKDQAQEKTEPRHPASRVFTAARGFEDEPPVTNPMLRGLF